MTSTSKHAGLEEALGRSQAARWSYLTIVVPRPHSERTFLPSKAIRRWPWFEAITRNTSKTTSAAKAKTPHNPTVSATQPLTG